MITILSKITGMMKGCGIPMLLLMIWNQEGKTREHKEEAPGDNYPYFLFSGDF